MIGMFLDLVWFHDKEVFDCDDGGTTTKYDDFSESLADQFSKLATAHDTADLPAWKTVKTSAALPMLMLPSVSL